MYNSYKLYQADHIRTAREQREEDIRTGELAADFGRLWHSLAPRRARRQRRFRRARTARAYVAFRPVLRRHGPPPLREVESVACRRRREPALWLRS